MNISNVALPVLVAAVLSAQETKSASVCATVRDLPGQPIRTAVVVLVNLQSSNATVVEADRSGKACATHLEEGYYAVEAGSRGSGFLKVRYYPVRVTYPETTLLEFSLPFGEIREGGMEFDSIVSGTLRHQGRPVDGAKICLFQAGNSTPSACVTTNDLGQYALIVTPGTYRFEISRPQTQVHSGSLDLRNPGFYRDRVVMPE